jgi:hypothetical protein
MSGLVVTSPKTVRPTSTTEPAEVISTGSTSHMITAFRQLNHLVTLRATLECTIIQSTQQQLRGLVELIRASVG